MPTGPEYTCAPAAVVAVSDTEAISSRRIPGGAGTGSHTNVTRVRPSSPADRPDQVRR